MFRLTTRRIRLLVQLLFFAGFLVLLDITVDPLPKGFPTDVYLRLSPLNGLTVMLARREILFTVLLPGALTLVVTILLGRVFCGWFCPMGTTIDVFERLALRRRRYPRPDQKQLDRLRPIKYVLLVGMLGAALLSFQPAPFLDPISLAHRSYITAVHAPIHNVAQDARNLAYRPLLDRDIRIQPGGLPRVYKGSLLILLMFGTVLGLSAVQKRFWCRHLCPLGALLALCSRLPLLKRAVSGECTNCMRCERDCKMGCIHERGETYRVRDCIMCYNCQNICPEDAVGFPATVRSGKGFDPAQQLGRRRLLGGLGAAIVWATVVRASAAHSRTTGKGQADQLEENTKSPWRIRPPAALPEQLFLQTCIRCGECMKVCPTNGLHPALSEAGIEGLFTPILVSRIGHCEQNCNACCQVCPTGAIQNFSIEDKVELRVVQGKAYINRSTCRPWYGDKTCRVCEEHCSYLAIETHDIDDFPRPVVLEDKCTGCGICERWCPVTPTSAIIVEARGEKRPIIDEGLSLTSGFTSK